MFQKGIGVFVTLHDDYVFDAFQASSLNGIPIIVFDYSEYGYQESWRNNHLIGFQPEFERELPSKGEYMKLHEWLSKQRIVAYFKRELTPQIRSLNAPFPVYPVDLLAQYFTPHSFNKDHWMARLGGLFHLYGHSHQDRKILHGALQAKWNYTVNSLGKMSDFISRSHKFHLLEQIEWFSRYPMDYVLASQSGCQLAVALPGFGVKAFRNSECCQVGVPVVADLGMEYAVQWSNDNAVMLPTEDGRIKVDESVAILENALLDQEGMYSRFEQATHAARHLHPDYFVENFINQKIAQHL